MIDLHCHILQNVDDGPANLKQAMGIIRAQTRQGVTELCLTPHLHAGVFDASDEAVDDEFRVLERQVAAENIQIVLHITREYFYDSEFRRLLQEGNVTPLGDYRVLMLEFGTEVPAEILPEAAKRVLNAGYTPMFAHVERYRAVHKDCELVKQLMDMGVIVQINAGALLGDDGKALKNMAWSLLRRGYVSVVASDCHDLKDRAPNLRRCYALLEKEVGRENAQILLSRNPEAILRFTET